MSMSCWIYLWACWI